MNEGYNFLRFLFTNYSESEYLTEVWIPMNETLKQFLQNSIENFKPMSYQTIYCQVYKSTCKGYKERLFDDLKKLITEHCQNIKIKLDENIKTANDDNSNAHRNIYIIQFINYLHQFHRAIEAIVPLFHYLDAVYVKPKLKSTIQQEFLFIYKSFIIETHLNYIFATIQHLINTPDTVSKENIDLLLQMINEITPEFVDKQRDLLKRFCNGEAIISEIISNQEDMTTIFTPFLFKQNVFLVISIASFRFRRTTSKRSVDDLPGEEDQPSAKRAMTTIKSPCSDS